MTVARCALTVARCALTRRALLASRVVCALASGTTFRAPVAPIRPLAGARPSLPPAVCSRPSYASRLTCSAAATDGTMVESNPLLTVSCAVAGWDGRKLAGAAAASGAAASHRSHRCGPPGGLPMCLQDSPFPAYSEVKAEHVVPGIRALLAELHAEVGGAPALGSTHAYAVAFAIRRATHRSFQVLCAACACAEQVDKLEASVEPTWEGLVQVRGLLPCWWVEHRSCVV